MTLKGILTVSLVCILLSGVALAKSVGNSRYASLVVDAKNGMILTQTNAGEYRYPASLTKMMTLYMAFSALDRGTLKENQLLSVSAHAAGQPRTKIGLRPGDKITAKDAIVSLVTISANDAAVVLAEALSGNEPAFALRMTRVATELGMEHTRFMNASGLHHPQQRTTAYDMARLAIALRRDFPQYYPLFSRNSFIYKGQTFYSHNHVVRKYQGADGVKTGFIGPSGFNLVTSVVRNGTSLVGVVFGGQTFKRRDDHMMSLLDQSFYRLAQGISKEQRVAIRMPAVIGNTEKSGVMSAARDSTPELVPQKAEKSAVSASETHTFDILEPYLANVPPPEASDTVSPSSEWQTGKPVVADFTATALDPSDQVRPQGGEGISAPVETRPLIQPQAGKISKPDKKNKVRRKKKSTKKVVGPARNTGKQNAKKTVPDVPLPVLKP